MHPLYRRNSDKGQNLKILKMFIVDNNMFENILFIDCEC